MSSMRIVLVDPLGDILFSGESVIARSVEALPETLPTPIAEVVAAIAASPDSSEALTEPEPHDLAELDEEGEPDLCPETMRSAGSGVFRAVDAKVAAVAAVRSDRHSPWRNVG